MQLCGGSGGKDPCPPYAPGSAAAMQANLATATAAASSVGNAITRIPNWVMPMPTHSLGGLIPETAASKAVVINGQVTYPGSGSAGGGLPTYVMPHPGSM